jgi:hypothetical protein
MIAAQTHLFEPGRRAMRLTPTTLTPTPNAGDFIMPLHIARIFVMGSRSGDRRK